MSRSVRIVELVRIRRAPNALELLDLLLSEAAPRVEGNTYRPPPYQPSLWLRPCDEVRCRLGGTLFAVRCADLQSARWPSGQRKGSPKHLQCVGCTLGARYLSRMPWYTPPKDSQPAEVLSPSQRRAKRRGRPDIEPDMDTDTGDDNPLRLAANMTPDDRILP